MNGDDEGGHDECGPSSDAGQMSASAVLGDNREPLVQIAGIGSLTPAEAREFARLLLRVAETAETYAFLADYFAKGKDQKMAQAIFKNLSAKLIEARNREING